ncbi:TPD1 protein homolog 1-like [Curcuma longa]|uniref:TPD1 protein homolog 1-like n=1 Tax=Curcuma longa TaxID=136217 RepID=UPI003D9E455E
MKGDSTRLFATATAAIPAVALLLLLSYVFYLPRVHQTEINLVSQHHRRLLQVHEGDDGTGTTSSGSTQRVGDQCSMDDIVVNQGATGPLPSGIPTYTVSVLNLCSVSGGCSMGNIHLSCGAFSSARLINPRIFRRLSINDCLLNNGRPLAPGSVVSFQYANSFSYRLAISNATCAKHQL